MTQDRSDIGAAATFESFSLAKEVRLIRFVVSYGRWLLLLFVGGIYFLSPELRARGLWIYGWLLTYLVYRITLKVFSRINRESYDTPGFRMARVQFMVLLGSALVFRTGGIESYFWSIYLWPLFASIVYFSSWTVTRLIYIEVAVLYSLSSLVAVGSVASTNFALLLTNLVVLFVLTMALYYLNGRFLKKIGVLSALYEVGKEIKSDLGLDNTLQLIAKKVQELTGSERSLVLLINEDTESVTAKGCGYPDDHLESFTLQEMREGISGWVLKTQEAVLIPDVQKDSRCTGLTEEQARQFKSKSLIIVPLRIPDQGNPKSKKVIGTLTAINTTESPLLTQDDLDVTKALADLAVIAVENARLLEETSKRAEEMAFANKMGKLLSDIRDTVAIPRLLLEKALEEFNSEAASLALISPKTGEIEFQFALDYTGDSKVDQVMKEYKMPLDKGIAGVVMQSGKAIISNDVQKDSRWHGEVDTITGFTTKSILAVPFIYNDQAIGVIEILNKRDGSPFLEQEKELLSTIASSAAIAIENARLLNQERTLREEAEALRKAYGAMSTSLDLKEVAGKILDNLSNIIEYCSASLQLIQEDKRILLAGRGFDTKMAASPLLRPISADPLVERIVAGKEPLVLSEPSADPDWMDLPGVRSWVGLPLIYDKRVRGLLTLDHDQPGYYTQDIKNKLVQFADTAAGELQKAYLFDIAQRQIREWEVINKVWQTIQTKLKSEDLLQTIVVQITKLLDCTSCSIFFPQRRNGDLVLEPKVISSANEEQIKTRYFKPDEGLVGWVFQHGQSLILEDATSDPRFAPARERYEGPRSMLVSPVKVANKVIGVISAEQNGFGKFSESDQRLVDALALQAGIAIERANAFDLLRKIGTQAISRDDTVDEILRQILSGMIEVTHTSSGVIYLISEDGRFVENRAYSPDFAHPLPRLEKEDGLTRQVLKTNREIVIPDIRQDPRINPVLRDHFRSMIVVPLRLEPKIIGVLYLNDENPHDFAETEISLILTLAGLTAITIENTRLSEGKKLRLEETIALNETLKRVSYEAIDLTSAPAYGELVSKAVAAISRILDANAAVYRLQEKGDQEMMRLGDCCPKEFKRQLNPNWRRSETPFRNAQDNPVLQMDIRSRNERLEGHVLLQRIDTPEKPAKSFSELDGTSLLLLSNAIGHTLRKFRMEETLKRH